MSKKDTRKVKKWKIEKLVTLPVCDTGTTSPSRSSTRPATRGSTWGPTGSSWRWSAASSRSNSNSESDSDSNANSSSNSNSLGVSCSNTQACCYSWNQISLEVAFLNCTAEPLCVNCTALRAMPVIQPFSLQNQFFGESRGNNHIEKTEVEVEISETTTEAFRTMLTLIYQVWTRSIPVFWSLPGKAEHLGIFEIFLQWSSSI